MNNNKKTVFCNNCAKLGHLFHQCKIPITSVGVIAIRKNKNITETLLIRRKDSLSFVDFMRGKYNIDDKLYLINLFDKMTVGERDYILNNEFEILWNYLWGENITNQYKNEEKSSKYKFKQLMAGIKSNNDSYNLEDIINSTTQKYIEPEWGFPKGRRNYQERDLMCGLREFEEETGYDKTDLIQFCNILPLEEIFTGSNYKSYKHKYYIGYVNNTDAPKKKFQVSEISKLEWVNINEAENYIRDYNIEKKKVIIELNKLLKTYKLYI
jgi:8-oxo-dGTP pyrophosphatase MutT (NUDIX family)